MEITSGAAVLYPVLYFLDSGGWFAALVPAVLMHELGHWAAIRCCGERLETVRLELSGLCLEVRTFHSRASRLICAAAGPAAGLLWVWIARRLIGGVWGMKSALAGAVVNGFNLLPSMPLDGGQIVCALTGSSRLLRWSSVVTVCLLLLTAVSCRLWGLLIPVGMIIKAILSS